MFANKVVLVTGGSSGIGASTAESFAKEGAAVAIVGRNEARLEDVAKRCRNLGAEVLAIKADVSVDAEIDTVVQKTVEKFSKLDVLVNNAGTLKEAPLDADNFNEVFDEMMNVNIRAPARITRQAIPHLIKTKGNIVNVSSVAATSVIRPNVSGYRTSKAALNHFSRCCAYELAKHGVRVNTVSPGPVRTNILGDKVIPDEVLNKSTLLNRVSSSDEIADLIIYVASDKAKSVTGSDYAIDNGILLK